MPRPPQSSLPFAETEPPRSVSRAQARDAAQAEAARLILEDPDKYGGEDAALVQCARAELRRRKRRD